MVSESQPWWAMVSAEKPFGMASQPLTAAPPDFHSVRRRFSLMNSSLRGSTIEGRPLGIELPAGNERLHRHGVVARAQAVLLVELVGLLDLDHVELDPQARLLRHLHVAADDLQRLL